MDKEKLIEEVEKQIDQVVTEGIQPANLQKLGDLVDIHKDLCNEEYWKKKEEVMQMRYSNYNEYNDYGRRGVAGTGRGGYRGGYGRRGVRGSGRGGYRGEAIEEMIEHYENYNDASSEMNMGNYGAEGEMIKSVDSIMKNVYEIAEELTETGNPEVMHIIKKYARKIEEIN